MWLNKRIRLFNKIRYSSQMANVSHILYKFFVTDTNATVFNLINDVNGTVQTFDQAFQFELSFFPY
jgi:hypothetical protein